MDKKADNYRVYFKTKYKKEINFVLNTPKTKKDHVNIYTNLSQNGDSNYLTYCIYTHIYSDYQKEIFYDFKIQKEHKGKIISTTIQIKITTTEI